MVSLNDKDQNSQFDHEVRLTCDFENVRGPWDILQICLGYLLHDQTVLSLEADTISVADVDATTVIVLSAASRPNSVAATDSSLSAKSERTGSPTSRPADSCSSSDSDE